MRQSPQHQRRQAVRQPADVPAASRPRRHAQGQPRDREERHGEAGRSARLSHQGAAGAGREGARQTQPLRRASAAGTRRRTVAVRPTQGAPHRAHDAALYARRARRLHRLLPLHGHGLLVQCAVLSVRGGRGAAQGSLLSAPRARLSRRRIRHGVRRRAVRQRRAGVVATPQVATEGDRLRKGVLRVAVYSPGRRAVCPVRGDCPQHRRRSNTGASSGRDGSLSSAVFHYTYDVIIALYFWVKLCTYLMFV